MGGAHCERYNGGKPLTIFFSTGTATTAQQQLDECSKKMAGNQGSPKKNQQPYQYTKLADVRVGQIINVYGIVKYYKKPFMSMKGELCQTLRIIDQSLDSGEAEEGLQCVLFANKKGTTILPSINSIGTIIRFHRLKIGSFKGKLQGVSSPGFSW